MTQLIPIRFDDNTIIYIEATEDVIAPEVSIESPADDGEDEPEVPLDGKGKSVEEVRQKMVQNFQAIERTIYPIQSTPSPHLRKLRSPILAKLL
jgi:hypothetical protein